jgi:uracil-DNA glycosylase
LNQLPAVDHHKKASVFWVGLSAVAFSNDEDKVPLSRSTRSGALVAEIENPFHDSLSFYKTNVVKCLPLKQDKIRYPVQHEMEKCFPNLEAETKELNPKIVFLLGKQVASFVLSKVDITDYTLDENFAYKLFFSNGICYVPVHHPSFVLVYKRKKLAEYINSIRAIVTRQCIQVPKKADKKRSVKKCS